MVVSGCSACCRRRNARTQSTRRPQPAVRACGPFCRAMARHRVRHTTIETPHISFSDQRYRPGETTGNPRLHKCTVVILVAVVAGPHEMPGMIASRKMVNTRSMKGLILAGGAGRAYGRSRTHASSRPITNRSSSTASSTGRRGIKQIGIVVGVDAAAAEVRIPSVTVPGSGSRYVHLAGRRSISRTAS